MQVFTPYADPFSCAECLDLRRLNKQIIECRQILAAISGKSQAWKNHPVVKQYKKHILYLANYMHCLEYYKAKDPVAALFYSNKAMEHKPEFLTLDFCNQHKRRLYTKNNAFYSRFYKYGESQENWYYVEGKLLKYINGKCITK